MAKKPTIFEPIGQGESFDDVVKNILTSGDILKENRVLKAIADSKDTPLIIGNIELECYVLEDETRVLSGGGMQKSLGFNKNTSGMALKNLLESKNISTLITNEIKEKFENRKEFIRIGSGGSVKKTYGYDATLLIDICDLLIEARNENILTNSQRKYAKVAEIIIRSVAKLGIIALIDEATGYQDMRARKSLQIILDRYLMKEFLSWSKQFPNEFFREIFRLRGWKYDPASIKRQGVIGIWINDIVYSRLAPGILEELKKLNPQNKVRNHQYLTEDIGHPKLAQHMYGLLGLMRISDNWEQFHARLQKAYPKMNEQFLLDIYDSDEDN